MSTTSGSSKGTKGTAVITGASAGLGSIYADRLARRGYDLLLVARRADRLEALAKGLRNEYGIDVTALVADLSAPADLARVATTIAENDSVSLLLNNAGVASFSPTSQASPESSDTMIDLNITALTHLTLAILPKFKQRDAGTIINIGSVLGFKSIPGSAVYSATKAFVLNFTQSLQDEVAGSNVKVQLVAPGATATDIWELAGVPKSNLPKGTVMKAEDCVDAALAGLDQGELVTLPSLENAALYKNFDAALITMFEGGRSDQPASRYAVKR